MTYAYSQNSEAPANSMLSASLIPAGLSAASRARYHGNAHLLLEAGLPRAQLSVSPLRV